MINENNDIILHFIDYCGIGADYVTQCEYKYELHKLISWFNTNKLHLKGKKSIFALFHVNQKTRTQNKHII